MVNYVTGLRLAVDWHVLCQSGANQPIRCQSVNPVPIRADYAEPIVGDLVKATVLGGVWCNGEGSVAWSKSPSIETLPCIHIEDLFYGYLHKWPPIGLRLASDWCPIGFNCANPQESSGI